MKVVILCSHAARKLPAFPLKMEQKNPVAFSGSTVVLCGVGELFQGFMSDTREMKCAVLGCLDWTILT